MNMPKGRPLTFYERERLETYLRMKKNKAWIARKLSRDKSIIKREIKRNSGEHLPYNAIVAQTLADKRATKTNVRKLDKPKNIGLKKFVEEKLNDNWSPEQIAGTLEEEKKFKEIVSHETIYNYVYSHSEKQKELYKHLRTGRKVRRKKFSRKKQKNPIKNRVSIH